ncbi:MAG: voltage-gated chloride channel, partial [Poseidonibacter sp.]
AGLSVVVAFLITGHRSIFQSQRLALKKADNINIHTDDGQDMGTADISLNMNDINKVKNFGKKLKMRKFRWKKSEDDLL